MKKTVINRKILIRNLAILLVSLIFLFGGTALVYADVTLGRVNFVDDGGNGDGLFASTTPDVPGTPGVSGADIYVPSGGVKVVNGLYHDDAIVNILLLGADDYQKNDVGRSDSMMLISIDTRNKELKVTSFMRDMFVHIPGIGDNKLNAAYSLAGGTERGAQKVLATIEANFGVDIDRWVIVDFSKFPEIIDAVDGVELTLTAQEAKLVNQYSADPRRNLKEGTFTLSGLQARYYSRIRMAPTADGLNDDYGRTQRQRDVIFSIITKLKHSDIFTINNLLTKTLPLVTTNMTKDNVLTMGGNALTYMSYPIKQLRIPGDSEYQAGWVRVGSTDLSALVPDLDACSKSLADFVFGGQELPRKK